MFNAALMLVLVASIDSAMSVCKSTGSNLMFPMTLTQTPCSFSLSLRFES